MELKSQIEEVVTNLPGLLFNEINNSIDGELFISKNDSYDVSIEIEPFPIHFPRVFEVGERIPRKVSRHIYSDTGSCCFSTQAKAQIILKTQIKTLYQFIKEIVIPYFINNSFFEINGHYKTSEYSHNRLGIIEGYRDILQVNNDLIIVQLISDRIKYKKLNIRDSCYCKSGKTLKKCRKYGHYKCYKNFRKIDIDVLQNDLVVFMEFFIANKKF